MKLFKKHRRLVSLLCAAVMLTQMIPGLCVSAAQTYDIAQPKRIKIGDKIVQTTFLDEKENTVKLDIPEGHYTMLTFWASWCPDCRQELDLLPKLTPVLKQYDNVDWYLVNLTDGNRETVKTASDYAKKHDVSLPILYDKDRTLTNELGIAEIPTMIILDPQGRVVLSEPHVIKSSAHLRSLIDYAVKGRDTAPLRYLEKKILKEEKVSSQMQGMIAEYASLGGSLETLRNQIAWLAKHDGTTSSLGGDLGMYAAMSPHRGFEVQTMDLRHHILNTYFENDALKGKVKTGELHLDAIRKVGGEAAYNNALSVIEKAYISDQFPLYYSDYNADTKSYSKREINTAESLTAVYRLAQEGKVKKETLNWLKRAVNGSGLKDAYNANGKKIQEQKSESAGLYALSAMIGLECNDMELFSKSLQRMEHLRTFQAGIISDGKFKSSSNRVFNQVMPLMLYAQMEQKGL